MLAEIEINEINDGNEFVKAGGFRLSWIPALYFSCRVLESSVWEVQNPRLPDFLCPSI